MRPLHIAFFNRSYYPDNAATGQLLRELCEDLVRDYDCRVSVVAGVALLPATVERGHAPMRGIVRREEHGGVAILRARGTRFAKRRFWGRAANYVTYFLSACYAGLRLERPDVIVALTDPPIIGLAAYLAACRFRVPLVMSYRDVFPEVARLLEDFQSERVNRVLQRVNCFLVRKSDRIIALGETMRRRLIEGKGADPCKTAIIPDWIDCSAVVPGSKDNAFSREHDLVHRFVVMHSGNIGLSQGLGILVDAAKHLRDWSNIRVVFVGEGVKKADLEKRVKEQALTNVVFLPYQPKEQLHESFASADVFAVSLKPGLAGYIVPSKVYGILAAGRPYVAAIEEDSEVAQIAEKYDCGLRVDPGDSEGFAESILRLYQDRELVRQLGANARQASAAFDRPLHVRAYYDLFREVAARRTSPAGGSDWAPAKRAFDMFLSGTGLVLSAPLWVAIALAVKLEDGGPVLYGQQRIGRGCIPFWGWKFRSMIPDADVRFGPRQASDGDVRVTKVGRFLRATALDELPQLWNIFKGDMSFVGPRALMPTEIETGGNGEAVSIEEVPGYVQRHQVRPGLTGVAQIYAPRDLPRRYKFMYDMRYIRNQSFWLDLRLIALSFWITFRGKWESRDKKF